MTGPELRARILAEAARTPSPTRAEHLRRVTIIGVIGTLAVLALFFAMGGVKVGSKPLELVAFTAGFAALATVILKRLSTGRPGSMLGRPSRTLVAACVVTAPLLALSLLVAAIVWPGPAHEAADSRADWLCGAMAVIQGLLPMILLVVPRRGADPVHPAITGASLGMTAGAFAAALAYVRCPHGETMHCLLAHVAPTLILTALGAALGRALLRSK
jgi:hypothetical protein